MPTKYHVADMKKAKARSKKLDASLAEAVNKVVPLHKVGINWFGNCPYCGAVGYLCVPAHGQYWQCLSCGKKGTEVMKIEVKPKYEF